MPIPNLLIYLLVLSIKLLLKDLSRLMLPLKNKSEERKLNPLLLKILKILQLPRTTVLVRATSNT